MQVAGLHSNVMFVGHFTYFLLHVLDTQHLIGLGGVSSRSRTARDYSMCVMWVVTSLLSSPFTFTCRSRRTSMSSIPIALDFSSIQRSVAWLYNSADVVDRGF